MIGINCNEYWMVIEYMIEIHWKLTRGLIKMIEWLLVEWSSNWLEMVVDWNLIEVINWCLARNWMIKVHDWGTDWFLGWLGWLIV